MSRGDPIIVRVMDWRLAVAKLDADAPLPGWTGQATNALFIVRTADELSIVCDQAAVPEDQLAERDWRALRLEEPLGFTQVGVIATVADLLADARVSLFCVSTYETDYFLVRAWDIEHAVDAISHGGHHIIN